MKDQTIAFSVTQVNYELSKSVTNMPYEIKNHNNLEAMAASSYAIASLSCVFGYAAIESFVNMHIYEALMKARKLKSKNDRGECDISLFDKRLANEYPTEESIENVIVNKPVNEKIKLLCELKGLKHLHENEPKLWQDLLILLKSFRDYVVHPKPMPKEYRGKLDGLLVQNKIGSYSAIAARVMKYFYGNLPDLNPKWLDENEYFKLKGITIL